MMLVQPHLSEPRIAWIDILRGLAIILMVPANFSPYLAEPHPEWYRILSSLAAPAFIALSGGLVLLRAERHTFAYYVKRGLAIICIGMLIDSGIWKILPWTSFDVLYIIGLSLPLMFLLRKAPSSLLFSLAILAFLLAPVTQAVFGYREEVYEIYFSEFSWPVPWALLTSFLSDGWFPMFPWIGFSLIGGLLIRLRGAWPLPALSPVLPWVGPTLLLLGVIAMYLPIPGFPNQASGAVMELRGGYSELFYPPGIPYCLLATGYLATFVTVFSVVRLPWIGPLLSFFGRSSMIVYILHQALGKFLIESQLASLQVESITSGWVFLAVTLAAFAVIAVFCALADRIRKVRLPSNVFLLTILGR